MPVMVVEFINRVKRVGGLEQQMEQLVRSPTGTYFWCGTAYGHITRLVD